MKTIFKSVVGSQAYGTNVEGSDTDYKSVHLLPLRDVLTFDYKNQFELNKDDTSFEVRRFLELAKTANPTMLELLFSPKDMIMTTSKEWEIISRHKEVFLTKMCKNSFGGYAIQQLRKAKGLDKKMNWEAEKIKRKTIQDFCTLSLNGKTLKLKEYLSQNELKEQYIGLVKLNGMADCYAVYYDHVAEYADNEVVTIPRGESLVRLGYKGVASENGNNLLLSSVPKYATPEPVTLYFNKSEYSSHCADYKSYQIWLENRNEQRYVDSTAHGQKIDGKNLLHTIRLLETAKEIAETGTLNVRRDNAKELIKIRKGLVNLEEIVEKAEELIVEIDSLYDKCSLPERIDSVLINDILFEIRELQMKEYLFENNNKI